VNVPPTCCTLSPIQNLQHSLHLPTSRLFTPKRRSNAMRLQDLLRFCALSALSQATKIYVSSYSGNITTVSISPNINGGNLTLNAISSTNGCSPNPSWLELDKSRSHLYCADEGLNTPMANFASFATSQNGSLTLLDKITTLNGGVYSKIYGNGSALALAN
jgi:hypothetical protein